MPNDTATVDRFARCMGYFAEQLAPVHDDQWTNPTPCTDWDVRALVNHVTGELAWVEPLVEGQTIAEVGHRFDGDLLGADPAAAYRSAADQALASVGSAGAIDGTVHLSYGDDSTESYVHQLTLDCLIHGWDLSRGVGGDDVLADDLVQWALAYTAPLVDEFAASGLYAAPLPVAGSASAQTRLLAVLGRDG